MPGRYFRLVGTTSKSCQDPRDAVLFLKENPEQIDLVVARLNMPSLNGIDLAAVLASESDFPSRSSGSQIIRVSHLNPRRPNRPNSLTWPHV